MWLWASLLVPPLGLSFLGSNDSQFGNLSAGTELAKHPALQYVEGLY